MTPVRRPAEAWLTLAYIVALSLVATLSIAGQVLVQRSLAVQMDDSRVVNVAGRQRMLSQQLSKAALAYRYRNSLSEIHLRRRELAQALALWEASHRGLQSGDAELGLPPATTPACRALFAEIRPHFEAIRTAARALIDIDPETKSAADDPQVAKAVDTILASEPEFLNRMDRLVGQFEHEAAERVAMLQRLEVGLLLITLCVLAAEGFFIFRPAVDRIRSTLTELRRVSRSLEVARSEAVAASEAKSQFLAQMSHELRTPLHAVIGMHDLSLQKASDPEERQWLAASRDAALLLLRLVDDVLDLARVESGKLELQSEPFDLIACCAGTVTALAGEAAKKGLCLLHDLDPALPPSVIGDADRFRQVLFNLIGNAIKFTDSGEVALAVRRIDSTSQSEGAAADSQNVARFEVSIRDTGIGIPQSQQQAIFDRFVQAHPLHTRARQGAGLGLAISQALVERMGGVIEVESEVGRGSTFKFTVALPIAPPALAEVPSPLASDLEPAAARRQYRILVAEDTPANQMVISAFLTSLGHDYAIAGDGAALLARYREAAWDVILMDVQMPDIDGYEATAQIRRDEAESGRERTPIIALTAYVSASDRERCLAAGMDAYLSKPLRLEDLVRTLAGVVGTSAQRASASLASSVLPTTIAVPPAASTPSPDPPSRAEPPAVHDRALALARLDGNAPLWQKLARMCLREAPAAAAQIETAIEDGDHRAACAVAHRLSNILGNLAAEESLIHCRQLEVLPIEAAEDVWQREAIALSAAVDRLVTSLEESLSETSGV